LLHTGNPGPPGGDEGATNPDPTSIGADTGAGQQQLQGTMAQGTSPFAPPALGSLAGTGSQADLGLGQQVGSMASVSQTGSKLM